jgi:hypothetical protein
MHVSSRWCVTAVFALGALSCSDPVAPPAQGAFLASIKAPSPSPAGKRCPTSVSFTYDVPSILTSKPLEALDQDTYLHKTVDGEDNASVSCKVAGSSSFNFSGRIVLGGRALSIANGTLGADKKGTAQITVTNSESLSNSLVSPTPNCVVNAAADASNRFQVKAGSMWASFTCPSVEAQPTDYCSANGFFVLENCEQ